MYIDKVVQVSVDAANADNDDDMEDCIDKAGVHAIIAALGPPGTGKTEVINRCIRKWKRRGARILFALPTGQLASKMRQVHPDIDIDTCHGAFGFHKQLAETLPILTQYDLVIVDELSMLTAEHFDRLAEMWGVTSQLPGRCEPVACPGACRRFLATARTAATAVEGERQRCRGLGEDI
eukprot:6027285-Amphidinium_carterae.3